MGLLNVVDLVLLVALLYAAFRGFRQGALSQVAAFGGAAAGLVLGAFAAPRMASAIIDSAGANLALLTLSLLLVCIFVGQAIGFAIGVRLRAVAQDAGAAGLDRAAGVGVGLVSILLVVWLLAATLVQGPLPVIARQVAASRVVSLVDGLLPAAPDLFSRVGVYLQQQGFPQVFTGLGADVTAPPVPPPSDVAVQAAQAAGQASTVQVQATGCGGISSGSGFVTRPGFVVTNAHVVAGGQALTVRDQAGSYEAVVVHFDAALDLAVLSAPATAAPAIGFVTAPAQRETAGATLGFPGGQQQLVVRPAAVRSRGDAVGRDIYGRGLVTREILTLGSAVQQGDSGGPFVTSDRLVGGVVFAASAAEPDTGYALTAERIAPDVDGAIARNAPVGTGPCRI